MVAVVVCDGDIGLSQHVLDGWIQLSAVLLQLELALWPATAQGQDHLQAGSSRSDHSQWIGIAWVFAFEKGKRGFQRFDGDPCGARPAHRSHIQAEPIEVECRAVAKVQKVLLRIQSGDFCFHESHPGSVTELTQVDGELVALIQPGDQPRHHS